MYKKLLHVKSVPRGTLWNNISQNKPARLLSRFVKCQVF